MVQVQFYNLSGAPYGQSDFDSIAASGYNGVELVVPWNLETSPGVYNFTQLDQYLQYAANDRLLVVLVFWFDGWTNGVSRWIPSWITSREVFSDGSLASFPAWYNATAQGDYRAFLNATLAHADPFPAFGGAYMTYGFLDFPWGWSPIGGTSASVAGYSPDTVRAFQGWLLETYGSLPTYNAAHGTSYPSFSDIPAPPPATGLSWEDFQDFRLWSVNATFTLLSLDARAHTNRTLFYYYGGGIDDGLQAGTLPDIYFSVARQFNGVVNLDDAEDPALSLAFVSLADRYCVRFIEEYTPSADFGGTFNQSLANLVGGSPWLVGSDFFEYNPLSPDFQTALPWQGAFGRFFRPAAFATPRDSIAALYSYDLGLVRSDNTVGTSSLLYTQQMYLSLALTFDRPLELVTDLEILSGAVNLSSFSSVIDLGGVLGAPGLPSPLDRALSEFQNKGGRIVPETNLSTFLEGIPPPVTFDLSPAPLAGQLDLEANANVSAGTLYLAVANYDACNVTESGSLSVNLSGWGLPTSTPYEVGTLPQGTVSQILPQKGGLLLPLVLGTFALQAWQITAQGGSPPANGSLSLAVPHFSAEGEPPYCSLGSLSGGGAGGIVVVAAIATAVTVLWVLRRRRRHREGRGSPRG
jgi:hypothetical protein